MTKFRIVFVAAVVLVTGVLAGGCVPRRHIAKNFGEANATVYANQKVRPGDTSRSPASIGVDEATAVRAKYVASFSGDGEGGGGGGGDGGAGETFLQLSGGGGMSGDGDGGIVLSPD